ncbi:lasso peptide biosynthesis PqqD family chaperone [Bacillus sp. AK128]
MLKIEFITLEDAIQQSEGNLVSDMDGEKVMLSIQNGKYYNLGEVGGEIWDLIQTPKNISQLVSSLTEKYEVEKTECEQHVLSFIQHLYEENLIKVNV